MWKEGNIFTALFFLWILLTMFSFDFLFSLQFVRLLESNDVLNSLFGIIVFAMTIYPPYTLCHLHPPPLPLQSPHCCPCPWVLFHSIIPHPTPLPRAVSLLSIYESDPVLCVSSACSLYSTYEWNHMIFIFLWLTYHILPCMMRTFLPIFLRERYTLYRDSTNSISIYMFLILLFMLMCEKCNSRKQ